MTSDVVLGFDDVDSYVKRNTAHFGGAIGRCANRIGGASFEIDGVKYQLAKNVGEDHLHGGIIGFDQVGHYKILNKKIKKQDYFWHL